MSLFLKYTVTIIKTHLSFKAFTLLSLLCLYPHCHLKSLYHLTNNSHCVPILFCWIAKFCRSTPDSHQLDCEFLSGYFPILDNPQLLSINARAGTQGCGRNRECAFFIFLDSLTAKPGRTIEFGLIKCK